MIKPPDNEKTGAGLQPDAGSETYLAARLAHNAIGSLSPATDNPQLAMSFDEDLAAKFERFHADNPKVYELLVSLAHNWVQNTGRKKVGVGALFERARWEIAIRTNDPDFKLNNTYRAFYARLIMKREEDLAGIFDLRRSVADDWAA